MLDRYWVIKHALNTESYRFGEIREDIEAMKEKAIRLSPEGVTFYDFYVNFGPDKVERMVVWYTLNENAAISFSLYVGGEVSEYLIDDDVPEKYRESLIPAFIFEVLHND
jgi:hypothetical protein